MVAHYFPCTGAAFSIVGHGFAPARTALLWPGPATVIPTPDQSGRANKGRHGPLRVPLHVASGCEGAGLDPGRLPLRPRPRRLRGPLLLPDARPAGARCRRQCALGGYPGADYAVPALCGGTRAVLRGLVRHQRGLEGGWRGEGDPHRSPEVACRHRGCGRVCRSWTQVSDLGTRALPRRARRAYVEGTRAQEAIELPGGGRWSTGMMAGSDSGIPAVAGGLARHVPV